MTAELQIITPPAAETRLDDMLVELTCLITLKKPDAIARGCLGGEFGYGADFENDVFLMHHYCWCERYDCPWCAECWCEDNSMRGASSDGKTAPPGKKCDWCSNVHRWADKGALRPDEPPHYGAPNFWHKKTGLRIWWYKWIGRDMHIKNQPVNLTVIFEDCAASIKRGAPHNRPPPKGSRR
jgi:hypothetical protein